MSEKLTVAIIGCGAFSKHFVELFKLHPHTEKVYVCDLVAERAKEFAEKNEVVLEASGIFPAGFFCV